MNYFKNLLQHTPSTLADELLQKQGSTEKAIKVCVDGVNYIEDNFSRMNELPHLAKKLFAHTILLLIDLETLKNKSMKQITESMYCKCNEVVQIFQFNYLTKIDFAYVLFKVDPDYTSCCIAVFKIKHKL